MGRWTRIFFVMILCIAGSALAEDVTYGAGEKPVLWVDSYGSEYAVLGPSASDTGTSDSISGNTVTVKNVTVPPVEESTFLRETYVYGATNSTDSTPVTGNTVILENAALDNDVFSDFLSPDDQDRITSSVYGGYAGERPAMVGSPDNAVPYAAIPVTNDNHVKVSNSTVTSVTGGDARLYGENSNYDRFTGNLKSDANTVEISNGSTVRNVSGGSVTLSGYSSLPAELIDEVTLIVNTTLSANGNQAKVADSTVQTVSGGEADLHFHTIDASWTSDFPDNSANIPTGSVDFLPITVNGTFTAAANDNQIVIENIKTAVDSNGSNRIVGGEVDAEIYVSDESDITVTATAARNHVTINGDETEISSNIGGGVSEVGTISGTAKAISEDNSVTINGGTIDSENDVIVGGAAGSFGYSFGYYSETADANIEIDIHVPDTFGTATAAGNSVTINGGSVTLQKVNIVDDPSDNIYPDDDEDVGLVGGLAETETGAATADGNNLTITDGTVEVIDGHGMGGGAAFSESGTATASNNTVTITGGTVGTTEGIIGGGYAESEFGNTSATGNSVTIDDGTVEIEDGILAGARAITKMAFSDDTATATGNTVTINGGAVTLKNVSAGDPRLEDTALVGGIAEINSSGTATVSENQVIITGGTVNVDGYGIAGGAAVSDTNASIAKNNAVGISGGEVDATNAYGIAGAFAATDSGTASATENNVILGGGTVKGNVYGGFALANRGIATATDNTVTVSGDVDLSGASLFGGGTLDGYADTNSANDFFTGNTLNILSDAEIRDAQNFENVNFNYSGAANIGTLDTTGGDVQLNTAANDINYTGAFSGTGSLTKIGTGVLDFGSNTSMNIGGKMTIRQGGFSLSDSVSLTADNGFVFGAGSEYTPNGNTLTVTSAIAGITIDKGASINLGDIDIGKTVLVSDSNFGITGDFDFDSMFYKTEFSSDRKQLSVIEEFSSGEKGKNIISDLANSGVTVGKNGVKGIGQLASILDSVSPEVEKELMKRLEALVDLADSGDKTGAAAGVQQILGQYSTRATQATHTVAQSFGSAVSGHLSQMRDTRMAMNNAAPGARPDGAYASLRDPRYARGRYGYSAAANRIWAGGFGSFASQGNDDGEFGYDYDSGGFILGYDHYFGDNITVGVTGAYSHGLIDGNEGYSKTDVDTLNFGVYGSYDSPTGFYAEANLGFGFTWNDEDEQLVGGGRRGGEFETSSFQMGGNAGYAFQLPAAFRIIPTIGLQYIHVDQDEYRQSGGILAMWRDASTASYLEVPIAVRINKTFNFGGVSITPELRAAWIIEAKQDDVSVRTGFVGSNASMFVSGTNPGRHRGLVGIGMKARFDNNIDAFVNYNLEFRNRYTNHNIMAGVGVSF